jgi:integral membrane protein (TIGR01906 family)
MPRGIVFLLLILLVISIPPFLVLSNLYIFMTPNYLDYEYGKPDFPHSVRFSDAERRTFSAASLEYVRGNLSFRDFNALGVYNDREIKHMVDVRNLIGALMGLHTNLGGVILIALVALAWSRATRPLAARGLLIGALLTVAFVGAVGLFAAGAFDTFFVYFHRVFFEGDSWLFYYTDSLIQFYPEQFWYDTAIALASLTLIEASIVGVIGWLWRRRALGAAAPAAVPAKARGVVRRQ